MLSNMFAADENGEPCGPSEEFVNKFSSFLCSIARNSKMCHATYTNWKMLPTKDVMWNYFNKKYIIPENRKKVVLQIISDSWRKHKHTIKKKYFDPFKNTKERLKTPPTCIPLDHFKVFINFWRLEQIQALCKQTPITTPNRKWKHRKGKLSFSLIKAQFDHLKGLVDNDGKSHDQAFHEVFGQEKSGRVRCGRRILTPTLLKKNQEMAAMTKIHVMEMASIKEDMEKILEERDRDMERKLEETHKHFKSMLKSVPIQMIPSLNVDAIDAMMPLTPRDANSGFNSSTRMHNPNNELHISLSVLIQDEGDDSDDDDDDEGDAYDDEMDHEGNDGAFD
ncbi:hypothetical protein ACFE04_001151 [Oxalis oulophora]